MPMAKVLSAKDLAVFRRTLSASCFGLASIVRCELEILCNDGGRSVGSLEQYRWSDFNHYAIGIRGVVEIELEWTARTRGPLIAIKPR